VKKKILTIVGARPQIIKASAVSRAVEKRSDKLEEVIVHTGQHYDENMSAVFFDELGIPKPQYNLSVGSGSHGVQTARMLEGIEQLIISEKPHAVLVYGDTNSTIAGALAAAKLHVPVIHVEAGLRSFNKQMPEEINRIACDHMSSLLFSPTDSAIRNLQKEGFELGQKGKASPDRPKVYHCGDIMFDNSMYFSKVSESHSEIIEKLDLAPDSYVLVTIHRDSNTDVREHLEEIFSALLAIQEKSGLEIVLPIHPRTSGKLENQLSAELHRKLMSNSHIKIIPPAGFLDIIALEKNARLIITDSGGLQKEAFFFRKPCVILRPQTEWVELVHNGNALLADHSKERILDCFDALIHKTDYTFPEFYGDGDAAGFICDTILRDL
jgi:UDP-GlcNAc3NAcA epimerase